MDTQDLQQASLSDALMENAALRRELARLSDEVNHLRSAIAVKNNALATLVPPGYGLYMESDRTDYTVRGSVLWLCQQALKVEVV